MMSRLKTRGFSLLKLFLFLGVVSLFFALSPNDVLADSNEATPISTNTATPLPSFTPVPAALENTATEFVVNIPVVQNSNNENIESVASAEEQAASAPSSFIQSISGVNQCLIGAIVLGLIAITIMVIYGVVQRIRA